MVEMGHHPQKTNEKIIKTIYKKPHTQNPLRRYLSHKKAKQEGGGSKKWQTHIFSFC